MSLDIGNEELIMAYLKAAKMRLESDFVSLLEQEIKQRGLDIQKEGKDPEALS